MKNLVKFSFLFVVFCFASCTKEYTCECSADGDLPTIVTIEAKSKAKAKKQCDEGDVSIFGFTYECEIK